ncbi:IclR family transcriptional regulator [Actinocorallia sp. A-T 12471]|uniref:IclR family transcriptional regulator n=1 Tax=Actinocorallia sp. A-T 12471 TaxID=3089813 RepID=UPI0029D2249D|nr:IclR family transcriptional regulator C-terminal domain-containing protein [Actinocorallia sp. A-T 12471]MDX6738401.1 IclR family transcriptional regulator C-terminal domain-containing protein [Actinocorallia sp. A-T 12471]
MDETRRPTLIASVQRALHLLDRISRHPSGAPAKQLARETMLPLATAYHLLRTLAHEGYIVKLPDGAWVMGERVGELHGRGRGQVVLGRIRPILDALRKSLNAAAYLAVHEDDRIRLIDIADSPRTPRVEQWVEFDEAAHATAIGKCLLGQLDAASRRDYLARHPLVSLTRNTITERTRLEHALTVDGLSVDREEYALGTGCAAVPVSDAQGEVVGALAVSCRPQRLGRVAADPAPLRSAAAQVGRALTLA